MIKFESKSDLMKAVSVMAGLQEAMNTTVNPEWRTAGNPWYRACWIELAEYVDHIGFKWWKKQTPDMGNAALEIVDVLHFVLSDAIEKGYEGALADHLWEANRRANNEQTEDFRHPANLVRMAEICAGVMASKQQVAMDAFALLAVATTSLEDLYIKYVAKNALNIFRQKNGDKQGTYMRNYRGVEDNDVVLQALQRGAELVAVDQVFQYIMNSLEEHYRGEP